MAAYIEERGLLRSKPTVKQHLAAIRMLFDWLVTGQVIPVNPVHAARGSRYTIKRGKTSILSADEMGTLLESIPVQDDDGIPLLIGIRDRALIALIGYTFARVGTAVGMKVEDYYVQTRRGCTKAARSTISPCHHDLEEALDTWLAASVPTKEPSAPLSMPCFMASSPAASRFPRRCAHDDSAPRSRRRHRNQCWLPQLPRHRHHDYLQNGGKREVAQKMAGHEFRPQELAVALAKASQDSGILQRRIVFLTIVIAAAGIAEVIVTAWVRNDFRHS